MVFFVVLKYFLFYLFTTISLLLTESGCTAEKCMERFEYMRLQKPFVSCPKTCQLPLSVAYYEYPPYISRGENASDPVGLLSGMLQSAISVCCRNCPTNVGWVGFQDLAELSTHNYLHTAFLPIANDKTHSTIIGMPYIPIIDSPEIVFLDVQSSAKAKNQLNAILHDIEGTWPILVISVFTTIAAGVVIWILDTWFNQEQFPRSPLRGSAEGSWWAFISMTTVGYGDSTPKSLLGRVFAVLWITFGITISGIFTAALSSSFTKLSLNSGSSIRGRRIAVMHEFSIQAAAVTSAGGIPTHYDNIADMKNALINGECEGMAMKSKELLFFHRNLTSVKLNVIKVFKADKKSLGVVFYLGGAFNVTGRMWADFLSSYFKENEDNTALMLSTAEASLPFTLDETIMRDQSIEQNVFDTLSGILEPFVIVLAYGTLGIIAFVIVAELIVQLFGRYISKTGQPNYNRNKRKLDLRHIKRLLHLEEQLIAEMKDRSNQLSALINEQIGSTQDKHRPIQKVFFNFGNPDAVSNNQKATLDH